MRSIRDECLAQVIPLGERHLRHELEAGLGEPVLEVLVESRAVVSLARLRPRGREGYPAVADAQACDEILPEEVQVMVESITYRDVKPTSAVKRELLNAREEIRLRFHALVSVEWTLETEAGEAVARCRVHSRSGHYRAAARSRVMTLAVSAALEKLITQRRRKKAMRNRVRGRGAAQLRPKDSE